jgi:osmotically inducible protein OsmC
MIKTATAIWNGNIQGSGQLTTQTNTLNQTPYSAAGRFESGDGTNPEELIAAAHAGCFSMALSLFLANNNMNPERIETKCEITLEKLEAGFAITKSHLILNATVPGANHEDFIRVANEAKANCPISKLLNTEITLDATLN